MSDEETKKRIDKETKKRKDRENKTLQLKRLTDDISRKILKKNLKVIIENLDGDEVLRRLYIKGLLNRIGQSGRV